MFLQEMPDDENVFFDTEDQEHEVYAAEQEDEVFEEKEEPNRIH